ncbi:MAG: Protecting protein DprA protein [Candidatus Levybacteria bacterium]|nr:Protecting protein DprA protein [Candidatus Levybacteria bacterium]
MGPAKFRKLLVEFGTAKAAWEAPRPGLAKLIGEENAAKFKRFCSEFSIEGYLKQLKEKDVWFVTLLDEDYPQILKEIKNPPFVLYGRGNSSVLSVRSGPPIAVVGARRTTQYGREVTKLLTTELVLAGFTIVSGLALGVDAISHLTALENDGKTIAVLGCGVDCCSPMENFNLYNSILEKGNCIVSEFPLGMKPAQWTFPARNRIIAGLSQAVLVTEGAEDSGSLITAKFALKFNRKVFAVPGPITSQMSKGPYALIQKGAKLVTSGEDILKELKAQSSKVKTKIQSSKISNATREELIILKLLENEPLHFDELVRRAKLKSSKLSSILSLMEIKGMIRSLAGGTYSV